jgi:hypothetical protein
MEITSDIEQQPKEPNKCQHEACMCEPAESSGYCSEFCENASGADMSEGCQCGHSECAE